MLSEREDELQKEIKSREEKAAKAQEELSAAGEQLNTASGKEKELTDKLKQKKHPARANWARSAASWCRSWQGAPDHRQAGRAEEAAAAVEEQHRATQAMQDRLGQLEGRWRRRATRPA